MFSEQQINSFEELVNKIIQFSEETLETLQVQSKSNFIELLSVAKHSANEYKKNPFQYREVVVNDCTGLAYRLSIELFNEGRYEESEKIAFLSYQLADALDWRERSLGALKQALLAGVSTTKWDDLDRLKSRVKQRIRKLLAIKGNVDRLPNGIDLNRLTDDVVWKSWEKLWNSQTDDDIKRNLLRRNLKFGWNYSFIVPNNPMKHQFRELARAFLAGDIATRIAIGEIEAEWIDLFTLEESKKIAEWTQQTNVEEIISTIQEVAEGRMSLLESSLERWLEWWRPLKTVRETDKETLEYFREAQQILFEETSYEEAVEKFKVAFELAPDDLGVKEWYAYALILNEEKENKNKDYSTPERLLQQIVALKRQDFATIVNLAGIYVRTNKLQEAFDLLCPYELFEKNTHRRSYVAAVLGLLLRNNVFQEIPSRIELLESVEWLPVGLYLAIKYQNEEIVEKFIQRFVAEASIAVGKKGSELSDINDPLVSPAQLDRDFAYFQEEGLIQEGILHFKERAEKYHWFWANWHHLGNLAEIAGDIQLAKEAFFKRALTTAQSKAPKKSKQDNWIAYLDFCVKHSLFDEIEQGIEYAKIEGVPNQKLNKYLRILHLRNQSLQDSELQELLEKLSKGECDAEEFIDCTAEKGIIAFELPQPVAPQIEWSVQPIPNWTGRFQLVAANDQDPLRKEIAVQWESEDGSIPLGVRLYSNDGRYDLMMKFYRTADRAIPITLNEENDLTEIFPDFLNIIKKHLNAGITGDVLVFEAPVGLGANLFLKMLEKEAETQNFTIINITTPNEQINVKTIFSWLSELAVRIGLQPFQPYNFKTIDDYIDGIKKELKHKYASKKRFLITITNFAEGWDTEDPFQVENIKLFLDCCLQLTECSEFTWCIVAEGFGEIRQNIVHPFWHSLKFVRLPLLNQSQVNYVIDKAISESADITERAKNLLYELSGGVYEILMGILKLVVKEFNQSHQSRILATNVIKSANQFAITTNIFSKWGSLLLPSRRPARMVLDRIVQGVPIDENSADITYLKEIGILVNQNQTSQIVTPLYIPSSKELYSQSTSVESTYKTAAAVLVDHENLYYYLKENFEKSESYWNEKDSGWICKISEKILNWVQSEHKMVSHPIALANWDREPFISHMRPYQAEGFYTIIPTTSRQNTADLKIYLEAGKILYEHPEIETIFLVFGNADFSLFIKWLIQQGKKVKLLCGNWDSTLLLQSMKDVDIQPISEILQFEVKR